MLSGFMAGVLMCVTSCLSTDDTEATLYEDAVVTNFYISSADVEYHTLSSKGEDSTYVKANTDVADIKFLIDQYQGKIYNVDSLPYGTDAKKLLCAYTTKNNGTLGIKTLKKNEDGTTASGDMEEDYVWIYLSTTDSIDFSYPRKVRVYAYTDHEVFREYTIQVNVKKSNDDSKVWVRNDGMILPQWITTDGAVGYGKEMAVLSGGNVVYTNADGSVETNGAADVQKLLALNPRELYAVSTDNRLIVSRDHGVIWTDDVTEDREFGVSQALTAISVARAGVNGVYHTVMFADPQLDCKVRQWETWIKTSVGGSDDKWVCQAAGGVNEYNMPEVDGVTVAAANSSVYYAIGKEKKDGAYKYIYVSRDGGLTWKKNTDYDLPANVGSSQWLKLYATSDGQLVAVCDSGIWTLKL